MIVEEIVCHLDDVHVGKFFFDFIFESFKEIFFCVREQVIFSLRLVAFVCLVLGTFHSFGDGLLGGSSDAVDGDCSRGGA